MQVVQNITTPQEGINQLMEKILGITKAREEFSNIVEQVQHQGDTYVISRHGKPAAAVVPVQVYENWKRDRDEFFAFIRKAQQQANLEPHEAEQIAAEAVKAVRAKTR